MASRTRPAKQATRDLDREPNASYRWRVRFFSLMFVLMLMLVAAACNRSGTEFHGVRMGMTAEAVRSHFDEGASFRTDGLAMHVDVPTAARTGVDVKEGTFEFHRGVLVAVRAQTVKPPMGIGEGARFSPGAVFEVKRAPEGTGYSLRWIARDCPAHAEEAETLLRRAEPL